jgi:hypothetical protein
VKLEWLDPLSLSAEHFVLLCKGCAPAGIEPLAVSRFLLSGEWLAFSCPGGVLAVSRQGRRMYLSSVCIEKFGWRVRKLRESLLRLAADLACDTVETTCYDARLARAMVRVQARPESINMIWQVKGR